MKNSIVVKLSSVLSLDWLDHHGRVEWGGHDGQFSRDPLPVLSAGGPCERFWHGQGRQVIGMSVSVRACEYICEYVYVCACACVRVCEWAAILPVSTSPIYASAHFLPVHTCLPQNCFFRNKNHKNPEHSKIFRNTSANVSPYLWNKSSYQILWENHRAIFTVHLLYRFRTAENPVCRSHLTVCQFNHFTTLLRTSEFTQVSAFSSTVAKDHFSWCTFLNVWKHLFAGDGFAGAWSKDSAILSIVHETFSQMVPWFLSTRLTASRKLQRNFFCFMSFAHAQSTSENKSALFSVFHACATRQKVTSVSSGTKRFGYSQGKIEKAVFVVVVFQEWQNPELLWGYPYFRNTQLIFMIFWNKFGRAVTVGMDGFGIKDCFQASVTHT